MSAPITISGASQDGPAYEDFYGFLQSPFTLAPDPRFLYPSGAHADALSGLLRAVRRRDTCAVLTGDIGTGKTTICRALLDQLDRRTVTSLILNPFLSAEELVREVLFDFGVVSRDMARRSRRLPHASARDMARTLHEFLHALEPLGGRAVLIVDEAQHLPPHVLEQVRAIAAPDAAGARGLQIVLAGQPGLLGLLARGDLRAIESRISLRVALAPLGCADVHAYVAHRLVIGRGVSPVRFDAAALDRLYALSGGVPRRINLICDRALACGAMDRVTIITTRQIEAAATMLGFQPRRRFLSFSWARFWDAAPGGGAGRP